MKHQWRVMWEVALRHWLHWFLPDTSAPTADVLSLSEFDYGTLRRKRCRVIFVTWSWWSKKVLIHALELASQTFTLLSDELRVAEDRKHFFFHFCTVPNFVLLSYCTLGSEKLHQQTASARALLISSASARETISLIVRTPEACFGCHFTLRQSECHLGRRRH